MIEQQLSVLFTDQFPFRLDLDVLPAKCKSNVYSNAQQLKSWENAVKQAKKAFQVDRNERKLKYVYAYDRDEIPTSSSTKKKKKPVVPGKKVSIFVQKFTQDPHKHQRWRALQQ